MLHEATTSKNNPVTKGKEFNGEGGSATGAFVTVEPKSGGRGIANGAAVGDAAIIIVHAVDGHARMLNCVRRRGRKDTGGQLTMCIGVDGEIWNFSEPVDQGDLILLATDGLTDNVHATELAAVIPLILRAKAFDTMVAEACPFVLGEEAHLPGQFELEQLFTDLDDFADVTCEAAAVRLSHYVQWITRPLYDQEQDYYDALAIFETCMAAANSEGRNPDEDPAVQAATERMRVLEKTRKAGIAGKTDDAMVVVMRPFHSR